jgi:hypothetical protein
MMYIVIAGNLGRTKGKPMSYCRCGDDSDIYMYCDGRGMAIHLAVGDDRVAELMEKHGLAENYFFKTKHFTLLFIGAMSLCGFVIPQGAMDRLKQEIDAENGDYVHCPCCPDQGWYPEMAMQSSYYTNDDGEEMYDGGEYPVEVQAQCEFCWTTKNSYFNKERKHD